jgi:hypothetical protein
VPGAAPGAPAQTIGESGCPSTPADRTVVPITKPTLGMSADYGLPPAPNTQLPDPNAKSTWSLNYSKAGVDTGEIIIRGGSHLDFSFIPNQAFGASLRGADEIAWYTTAWFDKYLKGDPGADARLLTERWRNDPIEGSTRTGMATRSRSTTGRGSTSTCITGQRSTARTCATAARGWCPATDSRAPTRTWPSTRARMPWSAPAPRSAPQAG